MGMLQERMIEDLRLTGYSATTRRIYVLYATRFARYFRRSPETMGDRELRRYLLYLLDERQVSHVGSGNSCRLIPEILAG